MGTKRQKFKNAANRVAKGVGRAMTIAGNVGNAYADIKGAGKLITEAWKKAKHTVRAIRGENPKVWYTKYYDVKPAANENRPMDPLFNTDITVNATAGSVTRFIDVNMDWIGYTKSTMFTQTVTKSYQALRIKLKSNLPYSQDLLRKYYTNAIALAVAGKMLERDVQWKQYNEPSVSNFSKMWSLTADAESYGLTALKQMPWYSDDMGVWSDTIADYDVMVGVFNTNIRLPSSLGRFISHYFGSVFVDCDDGYNEQYIKNVMNVMDWIDEQGNLVTINVKSITVQQLAELLDSFSVQFGIVLADLANSNQLEPANISLYGDYMFTPVYDKSYLQALINGYTDSNSVTANGFVRLDRMIGVEDDLTQFIFMGAIQPSLNNSQSITNVPAISIRNMVYKYDSDNSILWPVGFDQSAFAAGSGNEVGFMTIDAPFGFAICSTMQSDTVINAASGSSGIVTMPFGPAYKEFPTTITGADIKAPSVVTVGKTGDLDVRTGYFTQFLPGGLDLSKEVDIFIPEFCAYKNNQDGTADLAIHGLCIYNAVKWNGESVSYDTSNMDADNPVGGYMVFNLKMTASDAEYADSNGIKVFQKYANRIYYCYSSTQTESAKRSNINNWFYSNVTSFSNSNIGSGDFPTMNYASYVTSANVSFSANNVLKPINASQDGFAGVVKVWSNNTNPNLTIQLLTGSLSNGTQSDYATIGAETPFEATAGSIPVGTKYYMNVSLLFATSTSMQLFSIALESANDNVTATVGYTLTAAWAADQFDYHLPFKMACRVKGTVTFGEQDQVIDIPSGEVLVKEAYIPYYYNVYDLKPTLYQMFTSLFHTVDDSLLREGKKKNTPNKSKGGKGKREEEKEEKE